MDWKVSALGFGAMRLPVINGEHGNINEPEAIKMIRYAVDSGVNYIDSAWFYHSGNSEVVVGKALQDGYREKVRIATKLPCMEVNTYQDFDRLLNQLLERLQDKKIENEEVEISLESYPASVFFLKVLKENMEVKVFKIIKR